MRSTFALPPEPVTIAERVATVHVLRSMLAEAGIQLEKVHFSHHKLFWRSATDSGAYRWRKQGNTVIWPHGRKQRQLLRFITAFGDSQNLSDPRFQEDLEILARSEL